MTEWLKSFFSDPVAFEHIAKGVESVVVAIAVIVGATWTLFTFWKLNVGLKARFELAKLQSETLELPLINIQMVTSWLISAEGDGYYITGYAIVNNVGKRRTEVRFPVIDDEHRPFHLLPVKVALNGAIKPLSVVDAQLPYGDGFPAKYSRRAIVGAGGKIELPFVFKVEKPGVYLVSFSAFPSLDFAEVLAKDNVTNPDHAQWTGRCYVLVGLVPNPP